MTKNLSILLESFRIGLSIRVDDFDFDPPRALTAPRPASRATPPACCSFPRSWRFEDRQIADLPASLRADDLHLFNDTEVIPARLAGGHAHSVVVAAGAQTRGDPLALQEDLDGLRRQPANSDAKAAETLGFLNSCVIVYQWNSRRL
jgi:hypothetical protein